MFSEEYIGWSVTDNFVKDRMIDNSLTYKFASSSKIRQRTKTLNVKIKKYGVKDYKHYVKLKTNIIRSLIEDTETDISDNLSDTDYNMIYSSLLQSKGSVDDSEIYISTEEDFKKQTNTKLKENVKNTKASTSKKKLLQATCDVSVSKEHISWQKVTKKNEDISHLSNNQACINNDENTFKNNNDYLKAQVNNQSLSQQSDSQNNTFSITKSINENVNKSYIDSSVSESNSPECAIFNEITSDESEIQNYIEQNAVTSKSGTKLEQTLPNSLSKYQASSYKSINLENIEGSDNGTNIVTELENNNSHKLAEADDKNLVKLKNYSNTYESHKSKLLKNVRRNLISVLDKTKLMNNDKDIEKNKNKEDRLNDDQLLVPITSSTPKETRTKVFKNLSPNISSLDQQKDFEFDKNLQDKFDKIERSDRKNSTIVDITEMLSPQQFEKIANIETVVLKKSKKDINNILEKQEEEFSKEDERNSFQLDPIKEEVSLTDQESKMKSTKAVENIKKQQSSPKENHTKNVHSKSCSNILEKQDGREEFSKGKVTNSLQLNDVDKDTEINLIKHEDKNDLSNQSLCSDKKEHSTESKDRCNIQMQQLLPKITCSEIINKKYTIISKQDDNISIEKYDINSQEEISKAKEIDNNMSTTLETDNEEDNANYISPENKKRLQQQQRLNLVVSSDSSESEDEYIIIETSKKHNDDSDTSSCNKDTFENDVTNCEKINTDISCSKDNSIHSKEATPSLTKEKKDSSNVKIRKQADETALLTSCTYENNNSSKFVGNKNSLKEIQYYGNVYNNDDNQNGSIGDIESFQLRVPEDNVSCIEEFRNQFSSRNKTDLLDKKNFCNKSNQGEDEVSEYSSELGIRCKPKHEQNKQEAAKRSNVHPDISCYCRPYNVNNFLFFLILFSGQVSFDYYLFSYNN